MPSMIHNLLETKDDYWEVVGIEIRGELMPTDPLNVYFPTNERPYYVFAYRNDILIVATGDVKVQLQPPIW